jgi:hypothetical protein
MCVHETHTEYSKVEVNFIVFGFVQSASEREKLFVGKQASNNE